MLACPMLTRATEASMLRAASARILDGGQVSKQLDGETGVEAASVCMRMCACLPVCVCVHVCLRICALARAILHAF
jgi:hypothetical protein